MSLVAAAIGKRQLRGEYSKRVRRVRLGGGVGWLAQPSDDEWGGCGGCSGDGGGGFGVDDGGVQLWGVRVNRLSLLIDLEV